MTEWKCSADPHAVVPSDCNWPHCGCDPNVERVIMGLQECGYAIIEPNDVSDGPGEIAGLIELAEKWRPTDPAEAITGDVQLYLDLAAALRALAQEVERRRVNEMALGADIQRLRDRLATIDDNAAVLKEWREIAERRGVELGEMEEERQKLRQQIANVPDGISKETGEIMLAQKARIAELEAELEKLQALWRQADDRAYEQQTKGSP